MSDQSLSFRNPEADSSGPSLSPPRDDDNLPHTMTLAPGETLSSISVRGRDIRRPPVMTTIKVNPSSVPTTFSQPKTTLQRDQSRKLDATMRDYPMMDDHDLAGRVEVLTRSLKKRTPSLPTQIRPHATCPCEEDFKSFLALIAMCVLGTMGVFLFVKYMHPVLVHVPPPS